MIDANANRAREGLRVMEDTARFVLDDPELSKACKHARHDLQRAMSALPIASSQLLASRDTPGDVGTAISTDLEQSRPEGIASVASAACKRVTEALRTIEEAAKALAGNGEAFEQLRYRVYELEKQLMLRLSPACPQWSLCVLITRELCVYHTPDEIIRRASEGGAQCIQIREKSMPDSEFLDYAGALVDICKSAGLHAIINDRVAIAQLVNADGVHLGDDDLPTHAARQLLGVGKWIGRTCPTMDAAINAINNGADSCGLGPVFPSTTKIKSTLAGTELIRDYITDSRSSSTPHLAISGITLDNVDKLLAAGCKGIAVSSAVCSSEDPGGICRSLVNAITDPTLTP